MPRFFYPHSMSIGAVVALPSPTAHHINVLRIAPGNSITLFNGEGGEYTATLTTIDKKEVLAEIKTFSPREVELPYAITLAQGLPEGSKMDWIIEKAVENGASAIQPLATQRSVIRLSAERAAKKISHWHGIVVAASEQCGRNRLAHLNEPANFHDWTDQRDLHTRILLTPRADQSLSSWIRHHPHQALTVIVGPEGGFTEQEESLACTKGVLPLSMGNRILRAETAGIAAIAAINSLWGEM